MMCEQFQSSQNEPRNNSNYNTNTDFLFQELKYPQSTARKLIKNFMIYIFLLTCLTLIGNKPLTRADKLKYIWHQDTYLPYFDRNLHSSYGHITIFRIHDDNLQCLSVFERPVATKFEGRYQCLLSYEMHQINYSFAVLFKVVL